MKTKIKRHSRSVISVVLAVCMLISCMTVGLIATDAAKVGSENTVGATADSETVSADGDWYIVGNVADANDWSERDAVKFSAVTGGYSISVKLTKNSDFRLRHNSLDYGAASSSDSDRKVDSSSSNKTLSQTNQTFIWNGETGTYTVTINSAGTSISFGSGGGTSETWTVVGSSSSIFGTAWSPSTTSNDMTLTGTNTYTKSYTVNSTVGFEFKIVKDHKWGEEYPSSNFAVTLSTDASERSITQSGELYWESGDTITFTFNSSTDEISITSVTPETTHDVTFSAGTGGTISPSGTVAVGESTSTTITARPNDGYEFSSWTFGDGITGASTSNASTTITTKSSGDYTVTASFTKKPTYAVTVKSNSAEWGTVSASPTTAYEGQQVTVTATEDGGTFDNFTSSDVTGTTSGKTFKFTMPAKAVTVTANFKEYVGQSNYYYNGYTGYNAANGDKASGYFAQRMSEGKIGGQKYAYYYVSGRTGDQTFTVSYGNVDYTNQTLYWTRPSSDSYNTAHPWSNNGKQYAMFYSNDEVVIQDWTEMTQGSAVTGGTRFTTTIPDSARYARIKDQYNNNQTVLIDLNTAKNGGNNGFYISGHNGTDYTVTGWKEGSSTIGDVYEYFNGTDNGIYTSDFNTTGFSNHNYNHKFNDSWTVTHTLTKPKDAGSDYYILLFYPNTKYTYNDVEKTIGNSPVVVWSNELPDNGDKAVIYAKDGALRSDMQTFANHATTEITQGGPGTRKDNDYTLLKAEKDGSTIKVTTTIDEEGDWRNNYYIKGFNLNGVTPKILSYNSDGQYELEFRIEEDKITFDGGEVDYINGKYVEITPIYYPKNAGEVVTFYVRGYDEQVIASWGDTIAAYPFYNGTSGTEGAFGGYPGQPMINYGGKRYIDIPKSVTVTKDGETTTHEIQGITLSNNYWDRIHGTTQDENNLQHIKAVTTHAQTYDYDDFSKIFSEVKENNKTPDTIVFDFKYRTTHNNEKSTTLGSLSSYTNGWNDLENAQGDKVDIFGTVLEGSQLTANPIYAVSDGYWNEYSGAYSTEWHLYNSSNQYIGTINPSVRWIQTADHVSNSVYTYSSTKYTNDKVTLLDAYKTTYNTLKANYAGVPVKVTYEKEIRNESGNTDWDTYESQHGNRSGDFGKASDSDQKAKRSDGVWLYSFNGTKINANTIIEYSDNDGASYTEDPYKTDSNESTKGMKAYFTNSDFNGKTSVQTRSNKDDFFKFSAESAGDYIFVGWWLREADGENFRYHKISNATAAQSSMESGGTFVARFIKNPSGQLTISHTILKDETYKGDGTPSIFVMVRDDSYNTLYSQTGNSEYTIPSSCIKYGHNYHVDVMLMTTPKGDDIFARYTSQVDSKFFGGETSVTPDTGAANRVFTFDVDDLFEQDPESGEFTQTTSVLRYYSQLTEVKYTYKMTYHYTSYREKKDKQTYYVENTFTEDDIKNYLQKSETVKNADNENYPITAYDFKDKAARKAFIDKYGPYENNFRINLSWNAELGSDGTTIVYHGNTKTYEIDVHTATNFNDIVDLQIKLPYEYGSKDQNYKAIANSTTGNINYNYSYTAIHVENLTQMTWYATNGAKNYDNPNKLPTFVTAPKVIYNGTIPLYFRYWSVKTLPSDTNPDKVEYTRCYYPEFNLAIYQDSYVEPVYTVLTDKEKAEGYTPTPHAEAMKDNTGATITFIENSRNQYNEGGCGSETNANRKLQGDRVFTDFLISFASDSDVKYNTFANGTYTAGIAIERVAKLPKNEMGDYYTQAETVYQTAYGKTLSDITPIDGKYTTKAAEVKAFIEGTQTYTTDSNTENEVVFQRSEFDANKLDNKNRLDYYYSMSVRNHTGDFVNNHNSEYIYRAYSYIKDSSGKVVMLSETPLYFTIYDMASIANAAEGTVYDNPTS